MKRTLVLAISSLFVALPLHAQTLCSGNAKLSTLTGNYANLELLNALNSTRLWSKALKKSSSIGEFYITPEKNVELVWGWHETTESGCVQQSAKGLMVKDSNGGAKAKWEGPFIRYGDKNDDIYFQKIFRGCFVDNTGKRWNFGKNEITVDGKKHKAELMKDTIDTPDYGNPVVIDGDDQKFWVFTPKDQNAWAVYQDVWLNDEKRPAKGPEKSPPWRTLNPCPIS